VALTIVIKHEDAARELVLTFDAPRIVIGRGKGCDLLLPDRTVSKRHASIRVEGGRTLIVDEGSTNGLLVDRVKLPPRAPRALSDGDIVRIGRVWLEICQAGGIASGAHEVRRVALELCRRELDAAGEPSAAVIEVLGADPPARLELADSTREYTIGRARDADLVVADELSSRQHAAVSWQSDGWAVRDLGSKQGSFLRAAKAEKDDVEPEEAALADRPRSWRDGEVMRIGTTLLRMTDHVNRAYEEAVAAADVRMRPEELEQMPPGVDATPEPPVVAPADPGANPEQEQHQQGQDHEQERSRSSGAGLAVVDTAVVLVALGILAISLGALFWVLR
jgi:pSer/pThr/pTyr-binding forkhead associated (FHA) protein